MDQHTQSLRFAHVNHPSGLRMHYAEQGSAGKPVLILIHGYSDSWYSYSRVLPALAERYHVYALSQRGHGDTTRPPGGYAMADFAADVVAFMDALDLPQATLVGHSMGSVIAQQVALSAPERVTRLVLLGAGASFHNEGVLELQQAVDGLADPVPTDFVEQFQASTCVEPVPEAFLAQVVAESLKLPARVWQVVLAELLTVDHSAQLARIQAPTLIIWGEQDGVVGRNAQDTLHVGIAGSTLIVYAETGHAPHWERPEQVVSDVIAFMDSTSLSS